MKYALNHKNVCMVIAVFMLLLFASCNKSGETVVVTCNELPITESTFYMLMTEQALSIAGQPGITEENLVEKAKQETLTYLPAYTYYVQGYQALDYTLSEDDRGVLRANALSALVDQGFTYTAENRDEVFLHTFGATFDQYMDFQEQSYLISYFYQEELKKIEVKDAQLKAYFDEHQAKYAICTAEIFRYANNAEGEALADAAKEALQNGTDFETCKALGGWDKAEQLTFDQSGNLDTAFGTGFITAMVSAKEGDVVVFRTEAFITVAKVKQISGYTDNLEEIKQAVKEALYAEKLAEVVGTEAYIPKIVNQEVYDGITELPGKGGV